MNFHEITMNRFMDSVSQPKQRRMAKMANVINQKEHELSIGGSTYYIGVHRAGSQVILSLENANGEHSSALVDKAELVSTLRDLAKQVEEWKKEETGNFGQPEAEDDPNYWAASDYHDECGDR